MQKSRLRWNSATLGLLASFALPLGCADDATATDDEAGSETATETAGDTAGTDDDVGTSDTTTDTTDDTTTETGSTDTTDTTDTTTDTGSTDTTTDTGTDTTADTGTDTTADTGTDTGGTDTGGGCMVDEDCVDLNVGCQAGVCLDGVCEVVELADGEPCSTGDLCQVDEVCTAGVCGGGALKDCTALDDDCNAGVCDPDSGDCVGEPINEGGPCLGDDLCFMDTICTAGTCGGGLEVDCSGLDDACNLGVCDPLSGECNAEPANEGGMCDDGVVCTYGDVCGGGVCAGVSDPLFSDDFSTDMGWTVEGKWEIAMAAASQPGTLSGLTDPAMDHTDTDDEMLAGVLVGGLSSTPGHPAQYLVSPTVDLSVLDPAATVELRFWRWLVNGVAFMTDTIDVWDGTQWVNVYTAAADVSDVAWTEITIDVSAYKSADFQVRFGHAYSEQLPVGPAEPSWSVDDVLVVPVCP